MKKVKYKFNPDKAFRNFIILSSTISIIILIIKIAKEGIGFISTIGYFG